MRLFRFVFVVFCLSSIAIFTVFLRSTNRRIFYKCRATMVAQSKLKCDLATKQLESGVLLNSVVAGEEKNIEKEVVD